MALGLSVGPRRRDGHEDHFPVGCDTSGERADRRGRGGLHPALRGSKPSVAQAASESIAIARAIRGGVEHAALRVMGVLQGVKAL